MSQRTPIHSRAEIAILSLLAAAGVALGWNQGQLPRHAATPVQEVGCISGAQCTVADQTTSPDLQLYREVIDEVRHGRSYYDVARKKIPQFGFPMASPLNWRLPTYAWVFSWLPGPEWIQGALVALSAVALALAFSAHSRIGGVGYAAATTFLLFGVIHWAIDGEAYLAQEPWAATLILISLGAHALGSRESGVRSQGKGDRERGTGNSGQGWRCLAFAAGIAALFFRELALPYCGIACLSAAWNRRWHEAALWAVGIAAFCGFFAWHVGQVQMQLAGTEVAASTGLSQWLRFGGLDFVLLTSRMNSLLFAAPGWLLWLYLLAALLGLARQTDETSRLACLAALAYLTAFAIVGRPENFYWGLLPAPLLAWGAAYAPRTMGEFWTPTRRASEGVGQMSCGSGSPSLARRVSISGN